MLRTPLQISNNPYSAASVCSKMNENFRAGELFVLQSVRTGQICKKIVQKIVDCEDGNCLQDIIAVL